MKKSAVAAAVGLALAVQSEGAHALPEGGQVSAGQGKVGDPVNGALTIQQYSSRLAIDWLKFGIGAGESVHFAQPGANAIALNRVLGTDPSTIYGRLSATGQVFLLNPNGVLFAPGSQVNVGGLVASTLGLSNEDFLAGRYVFSKGDTAGTVVNRGEISAGYAALLGPRVSNEGLISATLGTVALAAGEQITLNLNGTSLVGLTVDKGALDALAANRQLIRADGGTVILTAKATDDILRNVVNNDGIIEARTISQRDGVIRLEGAGSGIVSVNGALEAKNITVTGDKVGLYDNASLTAASGTILVGGNFQGKGPERNSSITYVAPGANLNADAVAAGDGGRVIVWSDGITRFYGHLSARGGPLGGDGGFAEISGKESLAYKGTADLAAPNGHAGRILFDPKNFIVANGGASVLASNDAFNENAAADATVDADLITVLTNAGTAVTIQANNDITINEAIVSNNPSGNGGAITFQAGRSILINQNITTDNGDLTLIANETAAGGVQTANRDVGAALITMAASTALNAGSGAVTINMRDGAGRTGGKETSGDISLRAITAGTLNVTQGGATAGSDILQPAGVITVSGTSSFTSNGDISVTGANDFQDTVTVEGVRVSLTDNVNLLKLAPASVAELTVNAIELHLAGAYSTLEGQGLGLGAQSYNATLTRLTAPTTLSAPRDISMGGNAIVGPGSLTINHSNANSVSISAALGLNPTDSNPLLGGAIGANGPLGGFTLDTVGNFNFPYTNVGGNVSVTSVGAIDQFNQIRVTGTASFNSANDITLTNNNDFQGTVTVEGVRVRLTDNVDVLTLAPASVAELTVNAIELHLAGAYSTLEGQGLGLGAQSYNATLTRLTAPTTLSAPRDISMGGNAIVGPGSLTINHSNANSVSISAALGLNPTDSNPLLGGAIGANGPLGGLDIMTVSSLSLPDVYASGAILADATGNLTLPLGTTLRSNAAGNALTLSTGGNFINSAGAGALAAPFGRWLVYSTSPAGSTEGGLTALADATTPRLYNRGLGANPPSSIAEPGNRLLYTFTPAVTVTANSASRSYGAGNPVFTFATGALLTDDGVTDTTAAFTGALTTTAVPASPVSGSPFAITQGTLVSGAGYSVTYAGANLTITPAPLTITADNYSKVENTPNPIFTATYTGFVLGESSPNLQGALVFGTPATTTSPAGMYAITPSGNTSGNYAITYVDGTLTVNGVVPPPPPPAPPTPLAVVPPLPEVGAAYFEALAALKASDPTAAGPGTPSPTALPQLYVIEDGGLKLPEGVK